MLPLSLQPEIKFALSALLFFQENICQSFLRATRQYQSDDCLSNCWYLHDCDGEKGRDWEWLLYYQCVRSGRKEPFSVPMFHHSHFEWFPLVCCASPPTLLIAGIAVFLQHQRALLLKCWLVLGLSFNIHFLAFLTHACDAVPPPLKYSCCLASFHLVDLSLWAAAIWKS